MPKRSKKSKSKRVSLKQKHKVIKKVKEHHKKKAKEAKKLGLNKRPKVEKDPGIPNDWPFKEQELKALEARRTKALEEIEQKKAARKERAKKRKLGLLESDDADITDLAEQVSAKEKEFGVKKPVITNTPERAFYKELAKVVEASDVILEVLDARDPIGTRCPDMEKMVLKAGPEKHLVLLLNKIDLVPREAAEKWLKYLREELPTIAFKCSTQKQKSNLGWKSAKAAKKTTDVLQTSECLGAETLLKLLKNYSRSHEIKKLTVGVLGLPNVGKHSVINSLKGCHAVNVGAIPGLTRTMHVVRLDDDNVKLLDCPGVVTLKSGENEAVLALRNCIKSKKLQDPIASVKEILRLCPAKMLVALYKISAFGSVDDFLSKVATVRGKLKKGGILGNDAAARIILQDWNEGKIQYYTMPPTRNEGEAMEASILSKLGKEFNVDDVYGTESSSYIGTLKTVNELNPVEIPPSDPFAFDQSKLEAEMWKLGLLKDNGAAIITDIAEQIHKEVSGELEREFYKELAKVIKASDVILEVLDARDPIGTRCQDMEKMVLKAGPEKHLVLLLNKIDLVPREAAEKWLKYLREELPAVAFKCSTNNLQTSECLGAEILLKLLKNYSRSHEIKKLTVGVVGLPNVGKRSVINSLKGCHAVNVGATPGLTRTMPVIRLDDDNFKLLDCPGVVMLNYGENEALLALRNCIKIKKLQDPIASVKEILRLCPAEMLVTLYKISAFDSVDDFLSKVATVRGKLKKGGILDNDAAARIILQDWNEGKIQYYTMPPTRNEGEAMEASNVLELGKEFNVDEVYGTESSYIGSLKTVNELNPVEIPPSDPFAFDQSMLEDDKQPESTPIESNKDEDEAMAEEKDAPETKEVNVSSEEVVLTI